MNSKNFCPKCLTLWKMPAGDNTIRHPQKTGGGLSWRWNEKCFQRQGKAMMINRDLFIMTGFSAALQKEAKNGTRRWQHPKEGGNRKEKQSRRQEPGCLHKFPLSFSITAVWISVFLWGWLLLHIVFVFYFSASLVPKTDFLIKAKQFCFFYTMNEASPKSWDWEMEAVNYQKWWWVSVPYVGTLVQTPPSTRWQLWIAQHYRAPAWWWGVSSWKRTPTGQHRWPSSGETKE